MSQQDVSAVIIGAGKVGRGFIAHLVDLAGAHVTFIEWADALVEGLGSQGAYHIYIAGAPQKNHVVRGFEIVSASDEPRAVAAIARADLVFTAIGGERLASLGPLLAAGIGKRAIAEPSRVINIITCENWTHPGSIVHEAIEAHLPAEARQFFAEHCGIAESTVFRPCIEPTAEQRAADPFAVQGLDYWQLQVDGDQLKHPFPAIEHIIPTANFQSALERKLFTYSAVSATISFMGAQLGYRYLRDAAVDRQVLSVASDILQESGAALCRRYGFTTADQAIHASEALAVFQDSQNPDTIERHVRDPLRKLGRHDRLVGPAMLCLEEGIQPRALALAIAAGLRYAEPTDPAAVSLQQLMHEDGVDGVLERVAGIDPRGPLALLIKSRIPDVDRFISGEMPVSAEESPFGGVRPAIPLEQFAVQLVGPDQMRINARKDVSQPGPHEILAQVEAVGLCFSDVKLLKQFAGHPRKKDILSGFDSKALSAMRSYVPGDRPTVPGHEVACRIVAVGSEVTNYRVGERCLIQPDYRALPTAGSTAAFGYNFEGGLQEYVLVDERIALDPDTGEQFLMPISDTLSASAVALVEPWSCVENSYATTNRQAIKAGGRLLVVVEAGHAIVGLEQALALDNRPLSLTAVCADERQRAMLSMLDITIDFAPDIQALTDQHFDDIVYFGAAKSAIEVLNDKLAASGMINLVLGGATIGEPVSVGVGRVHYGGTRWIGTTGSSAADAYAAIPETGEVRAGDKVLVLGAGGPMGQMHVIRDLCSGAERLTIVGTDVDDERLATIRDKAEPVARAGDTTLRLVNTKKTALDEAFTYQIMLAPAASLVAEAVLRSGDGCLINIFAGIPAGVRQELDLDVYVARQCFMFGTSGTRLRDMQIVVHKLEHGQLDTNLSVDAVAGMAGAIDGLIAVENRILAGKIVVYPMLHNMGLVSLAQMEATFPTVAAKLDHGRWCDAAENELLRAAANS